MTLDTTLVAGWKRDSLDHDRHPALPVRRVNVRWFGAVGDGVTDDTDAIQLAVSSLGLSGGTVYFPRGVYQCANISVGGAGDPGNAIALVGEVPAGVGALERLVVDQDLTAVGTMLRYNGAADGDAILKIRNVDQGLLENLAFCGAGLSSYCVLAQHNLGDVRLPYAWTARKCSFVDAKLKNFQVLGTGVDAYGDLSALTFEGCVFVGSHDPVTTLAHFGCSTQYTFGTTFVGCWWGAESYPSHAIKLNGGTATVVGGSMGSFTTSCVDLDAGAGDFPSINLIGVECQSSHKFLTADDAGGNTPNRSSTITGLLADDINGPIETEMISWDVEGEACLVLTGCNIFGDVNLVGANSKAFVQGSYLRGAARFTGAGKAHGTWYQGNSPGSVQVRAPALPEYADEAAAVTGGLVAGDLYRTAAGAVRVKL